MKNYPYFSESENLILEELEKDIEYEKSVAEKISNEIRKSRVTSNYQFYLAVIAFIIVTSFFSYSFYNGRFTTQRDLHKLNNEVLDTEIAILEDTVEMMQYQYYALNNEYNKAILALQDFEIYYQDTLLVRTKPNSKAEELFAQAKLKVREEIQWVKVHNLPDLVYFNDSTRILAINDEIGYKHCHGEMAKENVARVMSPEELKIFDAEVVEVTHTRPVLTMGWCMECNHEAELDSSINRNYYNEIYQRIVNNPEEFKKHLEDTTNFIVPDTVSIY